MYDRFILNTMIKGWFVENNNEGGRRENSYNESRGGEPRLSKLIED